MKENTSNRRKKYTLLASIILFSCGTQVFGQDLCEQGYLIPNGAYIQLRDLPEGLIKMNDPNCYIVNTCRYDMMLKNAYQTWETIVKNMPVENICVNTTRSEEQNVSQFETEAEKLLAQIYPENSKILYIIKGAPKTFEDDYPNLTEFTVFHFQFDRIGKISWEGVPSAGTVYDPGVRSVTLNTIY